ncbi:hypothetical protein [Helicobacter heilmannii]|uniref:hypothetical protein n=1 Tax=Helicobacter heilmannii TaxID=35817 RepID=UPI0006A04829|nr:hypothetical protein [Helicobacter heilmannii]CRF50320.1 hypothetical protein HHE06_01440 [Helicobacter heilmannii]
MRLGSWLAALFLVGCSPSVVYQKVYLPTKCHVKKAPRPSADLDTLEYLQELLVYVEILEKDLEHCTKQEPQETPK